MFKIRFWPWIASLLLLFGCHSPTSDPSVIRVGTITGPETELIKAAQPILEQEGLKMQIVEFNDYNMPNAALADGSVDVNIFQHMPYLKKNMQDRHYAFTVIGKTFIYPMEIYSKQYTSVKDLPKHAVIAIPNDPSNESRALVLLAQAGLIRLAEKDQVNITPEDIIDNKNNIVFKELDAAQLPRVLSDVDAIVVNMNFAISSKLTEEQAPIYHELSDSPYANLIVVRTKDARDPRWPKLIAAIHSKAVREKAKILFKNQAIPAF